ncbi:MULTISPECIES: YqgE/AlgH family protein [unclassified Yoonia]|uniref:YqgE/AlgH family protein n=1 Tax=unclassified Yoonia TaxID=2629118 RepID=UPI002AFEB1A1|nr:MULTISPECIES: YqgE/AlgH family protein [unclassified Yoonia]
MDQAVTHLAGKLLIAMPDMADPRFAKSVIYICAHSDEGGMGLIVNKPQTQIRFTDLLDQMQLAHGADTPDIGVHQGGPVETARGFVLHSTDYTSGLGTLVVSDEIGMTATMDVLEDIAAGRGPAQAMLALGYAGWGPGQLEREIRQNGWLTCDPRDDIVFGRANEHKWSGALKLLGIDPLLLSATAGHA